ncbi:MAG: T9SS type A sorting domain-containing protein, partial [Bacteroidia bacterium]
DEGWSLDDIEVFAPSAPTVLTGTKTNVTTSNATLAGTITNNGGNAVTASGVVVSTSPNPTRVTVGVVDSATNPLVGNGAFIVNLTGLTASTTYYYRAYAVNPVGTSYGPDSSFTTPASAIAPTVLRVAATNVTTTTATFGGNITSDGGATVTSSGVVYSTSPNPVLFGLGVIDSTTTPLVPSGTFSFSTVGLTHSTKYYFRAYATNSVGTSYSTQDSFTTSPIISTLPYNQNFDGIGNTGWSSTAVGTGTNAWQLGTPAKTFLNGAYSGTNAWATRLVGDYLGTEDCAIVSPQFDFTSIVSTPVLRFRHKMDVDADPSYDGGVVEISINNGAWTRVNSAVGTGTNFNTANSYAWYNDAQGLGTLGVNIFSNITSGYSSQTNGWIESAVPLTGAAGQSNVRIRFRFVADIFTDEGWAIDDIEVVNVTTPTTAASNVNVTPSATSANVTFTAGDGQGRMVVARLSSTLAVAPTNNTLYNASAVYGSANTTGTGNFIVYMGNGTSVNVTGLTALTGYTFDVYEYNGKYMHNNFAGAISSATTTTPVKLVSLKATRVNEDVLVSWKTASEVNNRGFNIERSVDGNRFELVGFVKGSGNSSASNNYTFEDAAAFAKVGVSKLYYRLKQMDNDGKFEYSQVVTVVNDNDLSSSIVTYPNPFSDKLSINIKGVKAGNANIQVLDISGRLIISFDRAIEDGSQTLTLEGLSGLSHGVYFVRVDASGISEVVKMVKQ